MIKERTPTKVETHYQTLQVEPDAHTELIDLSFRRLAKKYHPDYNPTTAAMGKMQALNGAYSILRERETRRAYDESLRAQRELPLMRLSDRARNVAFLLCLVILSGLLFQFFNSPTRTIADSSGLPTVQNVANAEILLDTNAQLDAKATTTSTSMYLSKNLSKATDFATARDSEQADSAPMAVAVKNNENSADSDSADSDSESTDIVSNSPGGVPAESSLESKNVSGEENVPDIDAVPTRVATELLLVEPAASNTAVATPTAAPTTGQKIHLVPVTVEPEIDVTKQTQALVMIGPTSTPVPTPTPTSLPQHSISVPQIAPTAVPIVQSAVQPIPASQPLIVQQGSMHSTSSWAHEQIGSIRLNAPADNINGRKLQTFQWSADFAPEENQGFELIFWKPEQDPMLDGFGLAAPTNDTSLTVNLDELDVTLGTLLDWGHYRWGVLLVEREPYHRIALLGANDIPETRAFLFTNYKSAERQAESQAASAQESP